MWFGPMGGVSGWGGGWAWFGVLHMLLWWVFVVLGIFVLFKSLGRLPDTGSRADRALGILRERYARGEISREEFEQRKHDLTA